MDVAALKTALKRFGFDDNDPLVTWLNEGLHQFEMAAEWPFLQKRAASITLPPGTQIISGDAEWPTDFGKVISLRDQTHDVKLKRKTWQWFDNELSNPDEQGIPEYYVVLDMSSVYLWRTPDESTVFSLVYQHTIVDLVDGGGEVTAFPSRHHYAIVLGAAYIGLMAENEEDRAVVAKNEFNEAIARAIDYYALEDLDQFEQVVDDQGYLTDYSC